MTGLLWTNPCFQKSDGESGFRNPALVDTHLQRLEEDWGYKHHLAVLWVPGMYGKYNKRRKKDLRPCKNLKEDEILAAPDWFIENRGFIFMCTPLSYLWHWISRNRSIITHSFGCSHQPTDGENSKSLLCNILDFVDKTLKKCRQPQKKIALPII